MKTKTLDEIRAQRPLDAAGREAVEAQKEALAAEVLWHELRERRGMSQTQVAEALKVSRPRVSAIETSGADPRLSTLQRYVEALGGQLKISAVFDDGEIPLSQRPAA